MWVGRGGAISSVVIAIFTESFRPVVNGVSVSVETIAEELTALGHSPHVFAPAYAGHKDDNRFPVHRCPSMVTRFAPDYPLPIRIPSEIRKLLASIGVDVVHTQSPFLSGMAGARWARRLGVPLVTTYHTVYAEYVHYVPILPARLVRRAVIVLSRRHCNWADAVVVPTPPIRDLLRRYGVTKPITAIPTGVDTAAIAAATPHGVRQELGIPRCAKVLIYAGRLAPEKSIDALVAAFAIVAKRLPNAYLLLVGGGPSYEWCVSRVAALGLSHRVRFTGFVRPPQLYSLYAAADVMVHPSRTETQGLSLCEAMAAGLPCVAANAFGASTVVRHGVDGILTQGDADSLAEATIALLSSTAEQERMSRNAKEGAVRFDRRTCAEALLGVYTAALRAKQESQASAAGQRK